MKHVVGLMVMTFLAGCSGTSSGTGTSSTSSSGSPSSPSGGTPGGRCIGQAVPADKMTDIGSCQAQGGDWHRPTSSPGWCESSANPDVCGSKTRSDPGYANDYGKAECIRIMGCKFENPDGTTSENELLGATCSGTPKPCSAFTTLLSCNDEQGCDWNSSSTPSSCATTGSAREPCTAKVGTDGSTLTYHPEAARFSCQSRGCTFKRADGTVVPIP